MSSTPTSLPPLRGANAAGELGLLGLPNVKSKILRLFVVLVLSPIIGFTLFTALIAVLMVVADRQSPDDAPVHACVSIVLFVLGPALVYAPPANMTIWWCVPEIRNSMPKFLLATFAGLLPFAMCAAIVLHSDARTFMLGALGFFAWEQ